MGIKNALVNLNRLELLDVKYDCVDNTHLDLAIDIMTNNNPSNRMLTIYCDGGLIDTTEFIFKYPETIKSNLEYNYCRFKHGNLTFETSLKSQSTGASFARRHRAGESSWMDDTNNRGIIYIGTPSESDDDEALNFGNFNFKYMSENNNNNGYEYGGKNYCEYDDDEEEEEDYGGDDLAEFDNNEQEMYNELDEY